jgi:hypothetical protein
VDQTPQGFASEDEEATYCLSLLRDGDRHQKIVARERLSQIFEGRGMLDEAAQCLESNIREGVRDPRVYQRLAGFYRRQGRHELADEVLVEARRLAERMTRGPQPGARRPGPARPGRPPTPPPAPNPQEAPTAQLPASPPARPVPAPASPGAGRELELDRVPDDAQAPVVDRMEAGDPIVQRPWWLSPAMLILLILLCGPYGLALMWVRGGYSKPAKVRATVVWAGLMVLILAGVAVAIQSQVSAIVAGTSGLAGLPQPRLTPAPISPAPPAAGVPKATLPPGLAAVPPTPIASPGSLSPQPPGVVIGPAPAIKPGDDEGEEATEEGDEPEVAASPTPGSTAGAPQTAPKPTGEQVKVAEAGGTGVNMRERPGAAGPVIKTVPEGTILRVVGADQQMDGKAWKNVRDDTGSTGWIAAELLEPA